MSHYPLYARLTALASALLFSLCAVPANAAAAAEAPSTNVAVTLPLDAAPLDSTKVEDGSNGPVVIDNDEAQMQGEYQWKEIPDGPDKTHITAGARFPVSVQSQISSKTAKVGDPVEACLKIDVKIGGRLIAAKGSPVYGHVIAVEKARKLLIAEFTPTKRWLHMAGTLGLQFDEIINDKGEHIPLVATPAKNARIVKNLAEGRILGVNVNGQVSSPFAPQLRDQALHLEIRAGASAGGVFSFGIVPAVFACAGAISPSFAYCRPVGKNVRHRRLKGFGMGLVAGLPGGFLVTDSIIRGPEAIIQPGDVFEAEFKQDFTGEASTEANLLPGAKTRVHGIVLPEKKK
jgi:hypothetical protein